MWRMEDREEVAVGRRTEGGTLGYLLFLNSLWDPPPTRYANRVRSFRAAGRKAEGALLGAPHLACAHPAPTTRVGDLDQSPCVPRDEMVMVGTGKPPPRKNQASGPGYCFAPMPRCSVRREACPVPIARQPHDMR